MAAFKTLNAQDVIISPLHLNKGFKFEGQTALSGSHRVVNRVIKRLSNLKVRHPPH